MSLKSTVSPLLYILLNQTFDQPLSSKPSCRKAEFSPLKFGWVSGLTAAPAHQKPLVPGAKLIRSVAQMYHELRELFIRLLKEKPRWGLERELSTAQTQPHHGQGYSGGKNSHQQDTLRQGGQKGNCWCISCPWIPHRCKYGGKKVQWKGVTPSCSYGGMEQAHLWFSLSSLGTFSRLQKKPNNFMQWCLPLSHFLSLHNSSSLSTHLLNTAKPAWGGFWRQWVSFAPTDAAVLRWSEVTHCTGAALLIKTGGVDVLKLQRVPWGGFY